MIDKPFFRTIRQFSGGDYAEGGKSDYISLPAYADNPLSDIRSYLLVQNSLLELFEFIEPAENNRKVFSLKLRELLLRSCTEFESNCKSILRANKYTSKKEKDWNIKDYKKINTSHFLSDYEIELPLWVGNGKVRKPFYKWGEGKSLEWYDAYNSSKHDRANQLDQASLENAIDSVCGLLVILSAQYYIETFSGPDYLIATRVPSDYEVAIGNYFRIKFPTIPNNQRYNFGVNDIKESAAKTSFFEKFDYDAI